MRVSAEMNDSACQKAISADYGGLISIITTYKLEGIPEINFFNIGSRKYVKFQLCCTDPPINLRSKCIYYAGSL